MQVTSIEFTGTILDFFDPSKVRYLSVFLVNIVLISVGVINGICPFQKSLFFVLGVLPVTISPIFFILTFTYSPLKPLNLKKGKANCNSFNLF